MSAIWESRNQWTHDNKGYDPSKTMKNIVEIMGYMEMKMPKVSSSRPPCTWHGPRPDVINLKCDGAVREKQGIV
jgi:hypothetical protein